MWYVPGSLSARRPEPKQWTGPDRKPGRLHGMRGLRSKLPYSGSYGEIGRGLRGSGDQLGLRAQ